MHPPIYENAADEEAAESEEEAPVDVDDDASEESDGSEADDESEDEAVGDEDEGPTKVPFSAVSFKANRIMNLISTGFSPDATAKHGEGAGRDRGDQEESLDSRSARWVPQPYGLHRHGEQRAHGVQVSTLSGEMEGRFGNLADPSSPPQRQGCLQQGPHATD